MLFEKKTMLTDELMDEVVKYLDEKSSKKTKEQQVIYDYHTEGDFRLVRSKDYDKLDFKPSSSIEKVNEVYIAKKYEKDLIEIFTKIGLFIEYKRFRTRHKYLYNNIFITIDKYVKTGNILRVKFHYNNDEELKEKTNILDELFKNLNIEETSLERFEEIFGKYRSSWVELTEDINEEEFIK